MRICTLIAGYDDPTSPFAELDPPPDPSRFLAGHTVERHAIRRATYRTQITALAEQGFDLFINLCDGTSEEDHPGIEVVHLLEELGVAFTGARSDFYEPTRPATKAACARLGIAAPAGWFVASEGELARVAPALRFPLIVKHANSYCSIGLNRHSLVQTPLELAAQVARMTGLYGRALVEEFIAGREFTVLVAENPDDPTRPLTYRPIEFIFPPGESFKHFDLKWTDYATMRSIPCTDPALTQALESMAGRLFTALGGSGYARCDIRMAADGTLYMLEINANCGIFYPPGQEGSADFILLYDPAGPQPFVDAMLRVALGRRVRAAH
jgi:D-alanine-D-alanine ligase-like ATP-grasp enzyme